LTVGGRQASNVTSQTCEVNSLNLPTGQWKHITNIPAARSFPAVVGVSDKIIVLGGVTDKNIEFSNTVWINVFD